MKTVLEYGIVIVLIGSLWLVIKVFAMILSPGRPVARPEEAETLKGRWGGGPGRKTGGGGDPVFDTGSSGATDSLHPHHGESGGGHSSHSGGPSH